MSEARRHSKVANFEPRWHAAIGVLLAVALYVTLPPKFTFGPFWLFPLLVLALLVPLLVTSPYRGNETRWHRMASIALIAIVNFFNILSVVLLVTSLIHPSVHHKETGGQLLLAGLQIWATNIVVFSLWYWELDSDGPEARAHKNNAAQFENPDFQFPQMLGGAQGGALCVDTGWKPLFVDYVFLAFNTATALSPADTMPLTRMAKMLMMTQSSISFATIAVIVSRSINILG
ncbi:MAG: hypothetical protein M3126_05790 [Candidatus Eremiobacteraeota bacterium]|nr:hypothetical protein [Candidatus Eremiobacteraeota bacterium]